MNLKLIAAALFMGCIQNVFAQSNVPKAEYYSPEFNWTISIPPDFHEVNPNDWDALKSGTEQPGADTLINRTNTLTVFAVNNYNYFESNWQTYDQEERGNFKEHCKAVAAKLYDTFKDQIPEAEIDTAYSTQYVGQTIFEKFALKMNLPNGAKLNAYMYSHLFGTMEFSANIFYLKDEFGTMMLDAWLNSRFD